MRSKPKLFFRAARLFLTNCKKKKIKKIIRGRTAVGRRQRTSLKIKNTPSLQKSKVQSSPVQFSPVENWTKHRIWVSVSISSRLNSSFILIYIPGITDLAGIQRRSFTTKVDSFINWKVKKIYLLIHLFLRDFYLPGIRIYSYI